MRVRSMCAPKKRIKFCIHFCFEVFTLQSDGWFLIPALPAWHRREAGHYERVGKCARVSAEEDFSGKFFEGAVHAEFEVLARSACGNWVTLEGQRWARLKDGSPPSPPRAMQSRTSARVMTPKLRLRAGELKGGSKRVLHLFSRASVAL